MELVKKAESAEEHPGCLKRSFNVRDRLVIFQALNSAVAQGADPKTLARLVTLREVLDQDGVEDYFASVEKDYMKRLQAYRVALQAHVASGKDDPGAQPKQTPEELSGHEATYWVKAKLDLHIQDTLKAAKFDGGNAKYVVSLFAKYGIPIED